MEELREQSSAIELVISGYGSADEETMVGYRIAPTGRTQILWQARIEQASFVITWENYLFTVTETDNYCVVYLLKGNNGIYRLLDQKRLEGGALCHITYSPKHHTLYGACYSTGTIFGVLVEGEHFGEVTFSEIQPSTGGKALTRAHCVLLNAAEDKLLTVNIALDELIIYKLTDGIPVFQERIQLPEGVGPRHALFSADETRLYVITEYSNEIFVYQYGENMLLQRISTLPVKYQGISNCSTLCISKDGSFLYAANRGADTITQFLIGYDGKLEWIKDYSCGGKHPRHMLLTKQNERLIICNQFTDNVVAYAIDEITGALTEQVMNLKFRSPSGVTQL